MSCLSYDRTQWAVGQGFFHSGEVRYSENEVMYVYDCGSLNDGALNREIDRFIDRYRGRRIDMLFVSHYHHDHVSGLPRLLKEVGARSVVIPVIPAIERLIAVGSTIPESAIGTWSVDFAADPVNALRDIDPNLEIIQVPPPADDEDTEANNDDEPPARDTGADATGGFGSLEDVELRTGATSVFEGTDSTGAAVPLWQWKAYTTKLARKRRTKLVERLAHHLGLDVSGFEMILFDAGAFRRFVELHHKGVADAFASVFGDVNLSSLLVYSGPVLERMSRFRGRIRIGGGRAIGIWGQLPGWLGTGDQKMGRRRCDEVARAFRAELDRIGVLTLPHHGARSSYHPRLLEMFGEQKPVYVVSAGVHSQYGHPHREVLMNVSSQGGSIVIVNDGEASRAQEAGHACY